MKLDICEKCENFIQHYCYSNKFGITKINCGHCYKRQMNKKQCALFKETQKTNEKEISIFDEIVKNKIIFKSVIFKIETINFSKNKIEKEIKTLNKEKKHI